MENDFGVFAPRIRQVCSLKIAYGIISIHADVKRALGRREAIEEHSQARTAEKAARDT